YAPLRRSHGNAMMLGRRSPGRRPLRTAITAAGVAIGIGVMSMILSLAAGLQRQVVDTVTADTQLQTIQVHGALPGGQPRPLNTEALAGLEVMTNVKTAWGQTIVGGALGPDGSRTQIPAAV